MSRRWGPGASRHGLERNAANFAALEPPLGSLGTRNPHPFPRIPQPNAINGYSRTASIWTPQSNEYNGNPSRVPQVFPQRNAINGQSRTAFIWTPQSNEYNGSPSRAPQVFPQRNSFNEHPQHCRRISRIWSWLNQCDGHLPYAPSTREAEPTWQQPRSLPPNTYQATFAPPTLPLTQLNIPYRNAEHTAPAPSNVPARHPSGSSGIQDQEHRLATTTGTMNSNGHATHLQQQIYEHAQSIPHSKTRLNFKCLVCGIFMEEEEHLALHHKLEHRLRCGKCYELFKSPYRPAEHVCKAKRFTCDLCPQSFWMGWDLAVHRERVHPMAPSRCGTCEGTFSTRELLKVRFSLPHTWGMRDLYLP